ncbi:MAG: DUF6491 family protein [Pseudohongiellaceae bacterium]
MRHLKLILAPVMAIALAACATTDADLPSIEERMAERGYLIGPADQRIPRYRISSWQSVDDDHLIVRSGVRDHFLVELRGPCLELNSAFFVGFSTPTSRIDRFADVIVAGPGRMRERCSIRNIYVLTDVDNDDLAGSS